MSGTISTQRPMNLRLPSSIASATERVQTFPSETGAPFVHETGKETITFSNGGTLTETYGEGLLLTRPDGSTKQMEGAIRQRGENLEVMLWGHGDRYGGSDSWLQRIHPDGAVSFENTTFGGKFMPYTEATVHTTTFDPEGSVHSSATHMGAEYDSKVSTSLESGNVVYHGFPKGDMVVTPPVPMDWLIGA